MIKARGRRLRSEVRRKSDRDPGRAQDHLDGIAEGVDGAVILVVKSVVGSADGLRRLFLAPALCW